MGLVIRMLRNVNIIAGLYESSITVCGIVEDNVNTDVLILGLKKCYYLIYKTNLSL